jgi:hypothetical protein
MKSYWKLMSRDEKCEDLGFAGLRLSAGLDLDLADMKALGCLYDATAQPWGRAFMHGDHEQPPVVDLVHAKNIVAEGLKVVGNMSHGAVRS